MPICSTCEKEFKNVELHYTKVHADWCVVAEFTKGRCPNFIVSVSVYRDGVLMERVNGSSGNCDHGSSYEGKKYTVWTDSDQSEVIRLGYSNAGNVWIGSNWEKIVCRRVRCVYFYEGEVPKVLRLNVTPQSLGGVMCWSHDLSYPN